MQSGSSAVVVKIPTDQVPGSAGLRTQAPLTWPCLSPTAHELLSHHNG